MTLFVAISHQGRGCYGCICQFYKDVECFLQDEHVDANFDDEISTYLYAITSSRSSIHNKTKQNTLTTGVS